MDVKVTSNVNIIVIDDNFQSSNLETFRDTDILFVIDEDSRFIRNDTIVNKILEYGKFILIISRLHRKLNLGFSVDAIYKIKSDSIISNGYKKIINRFVNYYNLDRGSLYKRPICTEGGVSAPSLLRNLGFKDVKPIGSNGKVENFINNLVDDNINLFVDLVAFGRFMPSVKRLEKVKNFSIIDCKSLEHIILHNSDFRDIYKNLDFKNCTCEYSMFKTLEKYYTSILEDKCLKRFKYRYDKSEVPEFLIDESVARKVYNLLWNPNVSKSLIDNI